jgi:hypothetical protein
MVKHIDRIAFGFHGAASGHRRNLYVNSGPADPIFDWPKPLPIVTPYMTLYLGCPEAI